ncbi:phospholipase D family protein [Halomonas sp. M4R5S39]|uniref:phospholipase D family protein n=1 Tax=Halomonas kalidii TaxID=3043293 RepID=UPI0024A7E308|nr:phospholipase D family protein [Halomonas kalidii]MDI5983494.1 phospholipase D family protein [Halomonas kalidii]
MMMPPEHRRRRGRLPCWLVVLSLLAGCAAPPVVREHGVALRPGEIEATALGRWAREASRTNGGDSGFALLANGEEAFAVRARLVEEAERRVDVQTYLMDDGQTTRVLLRRLLDAAERGVVVRLLLDDVGAIGQAGRLTALDSHPNVQVRVFNPVAFGRDHLVTWVLAAAPTVWRTHRRMHNKLWVVDNAVAITGGRNLGDAYYNADESRNFADLDLLAVGPVVDPLSLSFDLYWNHGLAQPIGRYHAVPAGAWQALRDELGGWLEEQHESPYVTALRDRRGVSARDALADALHWGQGEAVWDPPGKLRMPGRPPLEATLGGALEDQLSELESRFVIISAYFVPTEIGTRLLAGLVESGVRVAVITNSLEAGDLPEVHGAYMSRRRALLESGVRLFELRAQHHRGEEAAIGISGSFSSALHIKALSFDDERLFVGSFNVDPRSLWWNTEVGVLVESTSLNDEFLALADIGMSPALSYEVVLDDAGGLFWLAEVDEELVRLEREPGRRWHHFRAWLSRVLKLEPWL